jgi:hypothetical protein
MFEIVQLSRVFLFMFKHGVDGSTDTREHSAPGRENLKLRVIVFIVRARNVLLAFAKFYWPSPKLAGR